MEPGLDSIPPEAREVDILDRLRGLWLWPGDSLTSQTRDAAAEIERLRTEAEQLRLRISNDALRASVSDVDAINEALKGTDWYADCDERFRCLSIYDCDGDWLMNLPQGMTPEHVRAVHHAYRRGLARGKDRGHFELQHDLRALLGVASDFHKHEEQ